MLREKTGSTVCVPVDFVILRPLEDDAAKMSVLDLSPSCCDSIKVVGSATSIGSLDAAS